MTPNRQRHHLQEIETVHTKRDNENKRKASQINHNGITLAIAGAKARQQETCLLLEGDALAPAFQNGDLLTVSLTALPLPGDAVVAQIGGKYGCMRLNADGDLWDACGGFVPQGVYAVAGVVLDRQPTHRKRR